MFPLPSFSFVSVNYEHTVYIEKVETVCENYLIINGYKYYNNFII